MRPNGAGTNHSIGVNGAAKTNGAAEPSMDEILSFLRGTLAQETERADARRPAAIDLAAPKAAASTTPVAKAETSAPAAQSSVAQPKPIPAPAQPATAVAVQPGPTAATAAPAAPEPVPTPLKPVSMPFKDTRFSRLSNPAPSHPEIVAEATVVTPAPTQPPASGDLSSLASARRPEQGAPQANAWPFSAPPSRPASPPHWTAAAMSSAAPAGPAFSSNPVEAAVAPPPVPASAPAIIDAEFNTVESAAADLLRPVLRQWLADNMPRIVEKALRIEMADGAPPAPPRRDK